MLDERNILVRELTHSFRLLTDFARTYAEADTINPAELSLLGRKLYTALEKRPGKVDSINPGISQPGRGAARNCTTRSQPVTSADGFYIWEVNIDQAQVITPIKTTPALVELLTWCHINGIIGHSTRISLYPENCPVSKMN